MKIKHIIYAIALCIGQNHLAIAQKITAKTINDQMPALSIDQVFGSSKKINLAEYKGKLVLIDFWATWCSPCVESMPHLDSLQSKFAENVQIICVTKEDEKTVKAAYKRIFSNRQPKFLTIINDTLINTYFPHQTIPHCVWINKNGIVIAITDKASVNASSISNMLNGDLSNVISKPELKKLDLHKPPYASNQLHYEDELQYHSVITKYREDVKSNYSRGRKNEYIACTNSSIIRLYQCAAGKFDLSWLDMNRIVCKGFTTFADSASIGLFKSNDFINAWKSNITDYAFTYELAVPDSTYSTEQIFSIMFEDLNRYFAIYGLNVAKKTGSHRVLALTSIQGSGFKSFKDSSAVSANYTDNKYLKVVSHPMKYLLSQLRPFLPAEVPFINQTGYQGIISVELELENKSLISVNKALASYGLIIEEKEEPIEVLEFTKLSSRKRALYH